MRDSEVVSRKSLDEALSKVEFTKLQLAWLEKLFPEKLGTAESTLSEYQLNAGMRKVVYAVRERVKL